MEGSGATTCWWGRRAAGIGSSTIGVDAATLSARSDQRGPFVPTFPTITHVALTVSDLSKSVPWYERLLDAKPVLDQDTGPFRHVVWSVGSTLLGLHGFP